MSDHPNEEVRQTMGSAESDSPMVSGPPDLDAGWSKSLRATLGFAAVVGLLLAFWKPLTDLAVHALQSEIHSHILLVPFISAYLIYIRREDSLCGTRSSPALASMPFLAGLAAFFIGWGGGTPGLHLSGNDRLSVITFSFFCFLVAGGFLFLGQNWMMARAFPVFFLIFLVPLPDGLVDWLETGSKLASAEAAALFFQISGTPVLRDGTIFQLPGMVVEVAQECSGIRSSLVLFITSLLASYLLLKTPWRRAVLIAVVIPLGIVRNGIRILVVSLLCVHVGPHMIHSDIHRRGGPVFFAFSLVPLFLFVWWLRRGEIKSRSVGYGEKVEPGKGEGENCKMFHA
jgi:exosortase C (VPDSG-CTERM-specific)